MGYGIVGVQETHTYTSDTDATADLTNAQLQQNLEDLGWTVFFSHNIFPRSAGTAIVVDTHLLHSGALTIHGDHAVATTPGRAQKLHLGWAGHKFDFINAYFPTLNQRTPQENLMQDILDNLYNPNTPTLIAGDFNFVASAALDRKGGTSPRGDVVNSTWTQLFPHLTDTFRRLHPTRPDCSFFHRNRQHASRLDRVYACPKMLPFVSSSIICNRPGPSDHNPIAVTLMGKVGVPTASGRHRVRCDFTKVPALDSLFQQGAAALIDQAPGDPNELVNWMPSFIHQLSILGRRLHYAARAHSSAALEATERDLARIRSELQEGGGGALFSELISHRIDWQRHWAAHCHTSDLHNRRQDIHRGERITEGRAKAMSRPAAAFTVPGLRNEYGNRVVGKAAATIAAKHYAKVSALPIVSHDAQQQVLQATANGRQLPSALSSPLGSPIITAAEVQAALSSSPSGKAPGMDGIPVEIYKKYPSIFSPFLARLYSALISTGRTPTGFLEGLITLIHKDGDKTAIQNHRPITLLNTIYRVMAKVIATRLAACLEEVISSEQTAFLRNRSIGDSIMLIQCLPRLLQTQRKTGLVVFCDFSKAYDTIDRGFLFSVMRSLGLGENFISIVKLLLPDVTFSRACVNGFISAPEAFYAGVRQGCPLAPILYLCIAEALLRYLKSLNFGISICGRTFTAAQYADDTKAFLPNAAEVPRFLASMTTFGNASGQKLNQNKTKILRIGLELGGPSTGPAPVEGITVATNASALGVTFKEFSGDPLPNWTEQLKRVESCYTTISRWGLTAFGRGHASGTYGISRVLHHAEYSGAPCRASASKLTAMTAKLVDHGASPADKSRRFAGVRADLLIGKPANGGFGAFPWTQHIKARHARLGLKVITGSSTIPWVYIARIILENHNFTIWSVLWDRGRDITVVGGHLGYCLGVLRELPIPSLISPLPPPGDWCCYAPLWGGLPHYSPLNCPITLESMLALSSLPRSGIRDIGTATVVYDQAATAVNSSTNEWILLTGSSLLRSLRSTELLVDLAAPGSAYQGLDRLRRLMPAGWWDAARSRLQRPETAANLDGPATGEDWRAWNAPTQELTRQMMLVPIGFKTHGMPQVPLNKFTVNLGTKLFQAAATMKDRERSEQRRRQQTNGTAATQVHSSAPAPYNTLNRRDKSLRFVSAATGSLECYSTERSADAADQEVQALFRRIARVRWNNKHNEPFWRLVYDGFINSERLGSAGKPCGCCEAAMPGRLHHFWECPAAQELINTISNAVGREISRDSIWLARRVPGILAPIWDVVCIASVAAMHSAGKHSFKLAYPKRGVPKPLAERSRTVKRFIIQHFWELLADFVAVFPSPPWASSLTDPQHPFIFSTDGTTLTVRSPAVGA